MADDPEQEAKVHVGDYVVCLVDILGQSQKLKDWPELPIEDGPSQELIAAMGDTIGTVIEIRDRFKNLFAEFGKVHLTEETLAALPEEQRQGFFRARDYRLSIQHFSDTLVFYAPLRNKSHDITPYPMFCMLSACALLLLDGLAEQIPLRGAITIGACAELAENDPFGPALAEAYHLESRIAGYPRIIISNQATAVTQTNFTFSAVPELDRRYHDIANACRTFMCKDQDGHIIVDFLGERIRALQERPDGLNFPVSTAYRFVRSELERFLDLGDDKLTGRYAHLLHYMESRLPLWDLSPEEIADGK